MTRLRVTEVPVEATARISSAAALTILVCFLLNMVDGMDILVMSYIAPALQKEWGVSPAELSIVFSIGLAGMALGGLVLAPLADRFGRRRMILIALSIMTLAMLASSRAQSIGQLVLLRFCVGTGIGTVLASIAALAARAAPEQKRSFAVGVLQAGYPLGAMLTGLVTAWALPLYGWRNVLVGTGLVSSLFVPLVLALVPAQISTVERQARTRLREVVAGPRLPASMLLWGATICGFMALYFIASWITKLAIEAGLPETQAILASAVYNFGAFVGTVGMSLLSARVDIRTLACVLLVAAAGAFLVFGGVSLPLIGVLAGAFVIGVTLQGGVNALYPIGARIYPDAVRATGIGWSSGIGRIGAFTGPMIGGWALSQHLPLVAVFGMFCAPLLLAALLARLVRFE